jgi:hypothetical protein
MSKALHQSVYQQLFLHITASAVEAPVVSSYRDSSQTSYRLKPCIVSKQKLNYAVSQADRFLKEIAGRIYLF